MKQSTDFNRYTPLVWLMDYWYVALAFVAFVTTAVQANLTLAFLALSVLTTFFSGISTVHYSIKRGDGDAVAALAFILALAIFGWAIGLSHGYNGLVGLHAVSALLMVMLLFIDPRLYKKTVKVTRSIKRACSNGINATMNMVGAAIEAAVMKIIRAGTATAAFVTAVVMYLPRKIAAGAKFIRKQEQMLRGSTD